MSHACRAKQNINKCSKAARTANKRPTNGQQPPNNLKTTPKGPRKDLPLIGYRTIHSIVHLRVGSLIVLPPSSFPSFSPSLLIVPLPLLPLLLALPPPLSPSPALAQLLRDSCVSFATLSDVDHNIAFSFYSQSMEGPFGVLLGLLGGCLGGVWGVLAVRWPFVGRPSCV